MRQIKLRAKIKGDAGVYAVWGIDWLNGKALIERACGNELVLFEKIEAFLEFTGLLDKNGIEIYERDIIKCPQTKFYLGIEVWKVEYSEIWGSYGWTDGGAWYQFKQDFDYEVIGNIYENPELLNQ